VSITSNTGPLIALAKSDHLGLLRDLFGEVRIPPAVESELFAKAGPETIRLQSAMRHYLRRVDAATLSPLAATRVGHLGGGGEAGDRRGPVRGNPPPHRRLPGS